MDETRDDYNEWVKTEHNQKVESQNLTTLNAYQQRLLKRIKDNNYLLFASYDESRWSTRQWVYSIRNHLGKNELGYDEYETIQHVQPDTCEALCSFLYIRNIIEGHYRGKHDGKYYSTFWYTPNIEDVRK